MELPFDGIFGLGLEAINTNDTNTANNTNHTDHTHDIDNANNINDNSMEGLSTGPNFNFVNRLKAAGTIRAELYYICVRIM